MIPRTHIKRVGPRPKHLRSNAGARCVPLVCLRQASVAPRHREQDRSSAGRNRFLNQKRPGRRNTPAACFRRTEKERANKPRQCWCAAQESAARLNGPSAQTDEVLFFRPSVSPLLVELAFAKNAHSWQNTKSWTVVGGPVACLLCGLWTRKSHLVIR